MRDIKIKFRTNRERWQSQSRIHELSERKEPTSFFLMAFERALLWDELRSVCCRDQRKKKKKRSRPFFRERLQAKHERDASEKDACSGAERWRTGKRGRKIRDANLPSRRRGQLCANAIPFSQVTRKTGHPPRSPYKKSIPVPLALSSSLTFQPPPASHSLRALLHTHILSRARRDPVEPIIT